MPKHSSIRSAVSIENRLVTDTDGQTQAHGQYRGCLASRGKKSLTRPDECVDFVDNMTQFVVGVARRQFQLQDQTVDLVDTHRDCELLMNGVFQ